MLLFIGNFHVFRENGRFDQFLLVMEAREFCNMYSLLDIIHEQPISYLWKVLTAFIQIFIAFSKCNKTYYLSIINLSSEIS